MVSARLNEMVQDEVSRIDSRYRGWACAKHRMNLSDWEDVRQDAVVNFLVAINANPSLASRLAGNRDDLRAYIHRCLYTAMMQWHRSRTRAVPACQEAVANKAAPDESRQTEEDARELINALSAKLDRHGLLALEIAEGTTTFKLYARQNSLSSRTAARHFSAGVRNLRNVAEGQLGVMFGQEARAALQSAVALVREKIDAKPIPQGVWRLLHNSS